MDLQPIFYGKSVQEILELGQRMGVPEISWGVETGGEAYVIYHWGHGDRKIYPNLREQDDQRTTQGRVPPPERISHQADPGPAPEAGEEGAPGMNTYTARTGDIGLTSISGAGGRAIRLGQWLNGDGWHNVQHAFVVVTEASVATDEMIVEAMPGGAELVVNWHPVKDTVYLRCPDRYRQAVAQAARGFVGVPYGWADYAALALHRFRIPTPRLKRFIDQSGSMICSQLADRAAETGGWHLFADGRWHGDVTPGDLFRLYHAQTVSPGLA